MKTNKASLKSLNSIIAKPLEILYNLSFSSGTVPDSFKMARVIPVYKSDPSSSFSNSRPISLLSIFNQILEKLLYNRLYKYLEKYNIIYSGQFGFRANHSTDHALLLIVDKIQRAIESGQFSCGIFLDLRKAFDTVDHDILLAKLYSYGIRGTPYDWFVSYLSNRSQFVSIGNTTSSSAVISSGVPQGSLLGPLLFLLYIFIILKQRSI